MVGVSVVTRSQPFESSWSVMVTRSVTVFVKHISTSPPDSSSQVKSQLGLSRAVGRRIGTPAALVALVSLVGGMGLGVLGGPVLSIGDVVVSVNEGVKGRLSTEVRLETGDGEDNVGRGEVDGGTDTRGSAEAGRGEEDGGADDEEEGKGTVIMTVVVELLVMVVVPSASAVEDLSSLSLVVLSCTGVEVEDL